MRRLLSAIVLWGIGCGSSPASTNFDLGDGGVADDLAGVDDGGRPDGGGGPDLAGETCIPSGAARVSPMTRARMSTQLAAWNGTTTMAAWGVFPDPTYQRMAWAETKSGAVVASGDLPVTAQPTAIQLFAFKSKYYVFDPASPGTLSAYGGGSWSSVLTGTNMILPGTTQVLALNSSPGTVNAVLYDGTTVGASQKISSNNFLAAASDGAGGFGVVTFDNTGNLHFISYDGTSWSAESSIGATGFPNGQTPTPAWLVHSGALWCFTYGFLGGSTTAWVLSGGTWSSATLNSGQAGPLVGNNGLFATNAGQGKLYVYNAGTWTSSTLGGVGITDSTQLAPLGSGFVFLDTPSFSNTTATIYSGTTWGSPSTITTQNYGYWDVVYDSSRLVLVGPTHVMTYESGSWTQPVSFGTGSAVNVSNPIAVIEGSDVAVVYSEPGVMTARARTAGTWSAPLAMPVANTSGGVSYGSASLARAGNGHVLAAWQQYDAGVSSLYASEYDGCAWRTPVALTNLTAGQAPTVAANASSFVIRYVYGAQANVALWNGSGVGMPIALGTNKMQLGSDGTTFVAAWADASGNVQSATSSDGQTWSAPQQVEAGPGWSLAGLASGPEGVLEYASKSGQATNISARVWHGGSWSTAAALTGSTVGLLWQCAAAVGNSDALVVCNSSTKLDAQHFAGGAWTDLPIGSAASVNTPVFVGSDIRPRPYSI
jgi:hypothetical protein